MSKRKISSSRSKPHRHRTSSSTRKLKTKVPTYQRFLGLSLLGGKNDRTCLSVIEYYPEHKKLFLNQLYEKIQSSELISGDQVLVDQIQTFSPSIELLALDVPLQLPKCIRCTLKCPGFESCNQTEIKWMWNEYLEYKKTNKNARIFTPYTQRCIELYLKYHPDYKVEIQDAFGANLAPLTARAHFLSRRLNLPMIEVLPELSFSRLGKQFGIDDKYLKFEGRSLDLDTSRQIFLNSLVERRLIFIYQQDIQRLIDNRDAFDSFICALTAYLSYKGVCEEPPKNFPKGEKWIQFPIANVDWFL